jgi:TolB-like protein/tetratricopeptide (TPR) repeat protein
MSLISELQRRNVIRVAMAYVALAWLVVQVLDTLAPLFGISDAAARLIVIILAIMLVPALAMAWIFEWTPDGLRRDSEVDHDSAVARGSAKALDRVIIGVLALAVVYFAFDKFVLDPARDVQIATEAAEQARDEVLLGSFGDRSIAVMPFADMSPDGQQQFFSDGVAEEIINLLSQVQNLRVISRSSAFSFKGQQLPVSEIAQKLDVRYIMEGSVRRAGDALRITAQMIDARTDTQLWSENFDRSFGDIFAIQDEIAAEVVDKLEIELTGAMPHSAVVDPEAYALYLQAKDQLNLQTQPAAELAEGLLQESLAIDDQNAAAWLLYWEINGGKVHFSDWTWPEWALHTREAVETALELDPHNVQAKAYLARLSLQAMSTFEGEARAHAYSMSLDPLNVEFNVNAGSFLRQVGFANKAIPYNEFAVQRDPLSSGLWRSLMNSYIHAGRYDDALEANTRLREIVGNVGGLWNRGMIHLLLGDLDDALACFEEWAEAQPESPHGLHGLILVHSALGNESVVAENLARLEQAENSVELLASAYAWLGRQEEALDLLDAAIEPPRKFGPLGLRGDPLYRGLRDYPRFQELLRKQGTGEDQTAAMRLDDLFPGPGLAPLVPVEAP